MVNQEKGTYLVSEQQDINSNKLQKWLQSKISSDNIFCSEDLLHKLPQSMVDVIYPKYRRDEVKMYNHFLLEGENWKQGYKNKLNLKGSIFMFFPNSTSQYSMETLKGLFNIGENLKINDLVIEDNWLVVEYQIGEEKANENELKNYDMQNQNYVENLEKFSTAVYDYHHNLPLPYVTILEITFELLNIELNNLWSKIVLEPTKHNSNEIAQFNRLLIQHISSLKEEIKSIKGSLDTERELTIETERQKAELKSLRKELQQVTSELNDSNYNFKALHKKHDMLLKRYYSLKNSKLGKMTILYWKIRNMFSIRTIKSKIRKMTNGTQQKAPAKSANTNTDTKEYILYRDKHSDLDFYDRIKTMVAQIPVSNGSKFYPKMDVKIGIIADELLYNSYSGMADFIYITRENFSQHVDDLDVFLVVTAWKGLNSEWRGMANPNNGNLREELIEMIHQCKEKEIKVVFYSKEDPVNYDNFIGIAKHCDYIFTTAKEKIESYKKDTNSEKVGLLSFGVNPIYHNPVGMRKFDKLKGAFFAGSWYEKYPERQTDTQMIFDGVIEAGEEIKIIDRNFSMNLPNHFFPKKYVPYVSPGLEHDVLQKVHKLYDWAINLNSVKYSETMFANRVYELQAIGNLMLSNYSTGINNHFPNVFLIHSKEEVGHILNNMTKEEIFEKQVLGIRTVMSRETTFQRLEQMFEAIDFPFIKLKRKVAVITDKITDKVQEMFDAQTYEHKELIEKNQFNASLMEKFDMITFFSEDKKYGHFYLEDMINAFKYTNSDYITKDAIYSGETFIEGTEHDYVSDMKDKYRTVFWSSSFTFEQIMSISDNSTIPNGYSIDRFEFNDQVMEKKASETPTAYNVSVIIPTYNNGKFLLNKCFESLKRSSIFNEMEIIIVDDGSTDDYTPKVIKRIAENHANVKTYYYERGGSGSASRPRNKGAELATAEYITYLDPDNEAVNDGYAKLYEEALQGNYDIVMGNIVKVSDKVYPFRYIQALKKFNNNESVFTNNTKQIIVDTDFKSNSIQALIVKRSIIINNNLKMVEGAAGQDTVFFYELMLNSKKGKVLDLNIHIYYAAVEGSTVNAISKRFFEKYYIMEQYKLQFLEENGLLHQYMEKKFGFYFENWFLKKLKNVKVGEAYDSVILLTKIMELYLQKVEVKDESLQRFIELHKRNDYETIVDEYVKKAERIEV